MIILDTNVISELMKASPNAAVLSWFNAQLLDSLYLTAINEAELLFGIERLPEGKRKDKLKEGVEYLLNLFSNRILPFDRKAAQQYALLSVSAQKKGEGFPIPDSYIAAIASVHHFAVATRDKTAFSAAKVSIINPYTYSS